LRLVIEQIPQRVVFACGSIEGVKNFGLGIEGQSSALCGTRDHFVRKLLRRGSNKVVRLQIQLSQDCSERLRTKVSFNSFIHIFSQYYKQAQDARCKTEDSVQRTVKTQGRS
jgi:hypothetical protein